MQSSAWILTLAYASCMTLNKSLSLSKHHFLHLSPTVLISGSQTVLYMISNQGTLLKMSFLRRCSKRFGFSAFWGGLHNLFLLEILPQVILMHVSLKAVFSETPISFFFFFFLIPFPLVLSSAEKGEEVLISPGTSFPFPYMFVGECEERWQPN